MLKRKFNPDKELKKAQKQGIYNPKLKVASLFVSIILVIFITSSFAWFTSSSGINEAFSGNVVNRVSVKIKVINGSISGDAIKKVNVPNSTTFSVTPDTNYYYSNANAVTCTNDQSASYDSSNNTLTISPTKNTECSITFVNDVTVTLAAYNGSISGTLTKTVESYSQTTFDDLTITPDSTYQLMDIICTNSQSAEYDSTNNELTITPILDTTCTLVFGDNTMLLSTKIMARGVEANTPSSTAFQYGEPTTQVGVSGATYTEVTANYTTALTSDSDKTVGLGYTFDSSTGKYTLTNTTDNVSYDASYIGYYTCNSDTYENCSTMYKISTVNGSSVTASTKYTQIGSISGSGLFSATDDDGTSYYYRGEINDNYVNFAGKTWRIVRINGDGSIRLILNATNTAGRYNNVSSYDKKYIGYTYDNSTNCTGDSICTSSYDIITNSFLNNKNVTNSTIKENNENWYVTNILGYDSQIVLGSFCNDTTFTTSGSNIFYSSRNRIISNHPSLECPNTNVDYGGIYKLKIGLITADELLMAGFRNDTTQGSNKNYLYTTGNFWTMSPISAYTSTLYVCSVRNANIFNGNYDLTNNGANYYLKQVINIKSTSIVTSGDGTSSTPYEIYSPN